MDLSALRASLADERPSAGLSLALQALWHEARGDWARIAAALLQG